MGEQGIGSDHHAAQIDAGQMYNRSFSDLDDHPWHVMWMDPAAQQGTEESAASAQDAVA